MKTASKFMFIAGEASGDTLAAELVRALRQARPEAALEFFGAGGPKMAEAGVNLSVDMTVHSVIGLIEVLKNYFRFLRIFNDLLRRATEEKPDFIICVDFSGFNRRFAAAVRAHIRKHPQTCAGWQPKIIQYVSPQVWASRPGRAAKMAQDIDLLLCIFPFEKAWYAERVPGLRVEFVGHPIIDRYAGRTPAANTPRPQPPLALLLPGSRKGELKRHLPVMLAAAQQLAATAPVQFKMVLPSESLVQLAHTLGPLPAAVTVQVGGLAEALAQVELAFASTGTVLMECAYFGVPTVAMYKTSWSTYQIGKRIIQVKYLSMPNLLADAVVYPEFVQGDATAANLTAAAREFLQSPTRRTAVQAQLKKIIAGLGQPGASQRAAQAVWSLR